MTAAPPRGPRVALLGTPGAGKTALAKALGERLGWEVFSSGDALRQAALRDPVIAAQLGAGQLGPEAIVLQAVEEAHRAVGPRGLVLDGFPRHAAQLSQADRILGTWTALILTVNPSTAAQRVLARAQCAQCGSPAPPGQSLTDPCPSCGAMRWERRAEDLAGTRERRAHAFALDVAEMQHRLPPERASIINANRDFETVVTAAIRSIRGAMTVSSGLVY
jgi:adenylate kinase family enzyme